MPLIVEGGRVPPRWAEERNGHPKGHVTGTSTIKRERLNIAFVNNMPDAALEDTELQFFHLLDNASGDAQVHVKLYSLTGIPRTDRGQRHLRDFYYPLDELWHNQFDGVIITGTEPRQPNLRDEPYWGVLGDVFDWAERNTASAVLSCLAAHASVLHSDNIQRHRLPDKQFGVFETGKACDHAILDQTSEKIRFPHSRWNEVREEELTGAGYTVLTKSVGAGVDAFVKRKRNSLFLHFQGHPEYGAHTLFKEYRRDIKRYLNHERDTYPTMPQGYFDAPSSDLLSEFQNNARADRREEVMDLFPEAAIVGGLQDGWHDTAARLYKNWLHYLLATEAKSPALTAMKSLCTGPGEVLSHG